MNDDKLQQLIDRQAITDGLHWYTRWVDLNRVDMQVQIFAEDGRISFGGDNFVLYAQYHDRWVRTAEGWRIKERRLKTAATEGRPGGEAGMDLIGRAPSRTA